MATGYDSRLFILSITPNVQAMKEKETCPLEGLTPREVQALKPLVVKKMQDERLKWFRCRIDRIFSRWSGIDTSKNGCPCFLSEDDAETPDDAIRTRQYASELCGIIKTLAQKGGAR